MKKEANLANLEGDSTRHVASDGKAYYDAVQFHPLLRQKEVTLLSPARPLRAPKGNVRYAGLDMRPWLRHTQAGLRRHLGLTTSC